MSLNELNNTRVRHKVGTGSLPSVSSGSIVYSADSGRMYLDTPDGRIELHSDLPYGTLGSENNNVTVDKNIVLSTGTSIRVYGNHIPTTLNVNSTGSVNVKLNGSTLSTSKSLDGNTVTIYTYVQSESAWVVGTSTSESGGGGGGTSDLVLVNTASTESEGVKIDHVTLSSICSAYASGKIVKLVIPAEGAVFDLDFAIVEDVRADVLFSVMISEKEKAYLLFSDDPDEDEAVADFSNVTYQIEGSSDPGIRIVDSNFGDIRFYGGFQETVTDLFKGKISTDDPIGDKLLLTYCDMSKGILLSRTGLEINYLVLLSGYNYYIKIYHTDSSTLPTGEKRLFTYEDDNQNTNYVNLSYTPVANFQTSGNEPSLSSIQIGGIKYKIAQTDWEQSDNTAVDYVKNKPFYSESRVFNASESDFTFSSELNIMMYKISDLVFSEESLRNSSGVITLGDGSVVNFSGQDFFEDLNGVKMLITAQGIPLVASSDDFTLVGLPSTYYGTYLLGIYEKDTWQSRVSSFNVEVVQQVDNKFINFSSAISSIYTIKTLEYQNFNYDDFIDYRVKKIEKLAFPSSNISSIVIPSVVSIGEGAFIGCRFGGQSGRSLIDFSKYNSLTSLGGGLFAINHLVSLSNDSIFKDDNVIGISIPGRVVDDIEISPYVLNGVRNGTIIVRERDSSSDLEDFISRMKSQGVFAVGSGPSGDSATLSEMKNIVDSVDDFSTIDEDWSTILSNISSGNHNQYLKRTKKAYCKYTKDGNLVEAVVYLQCVGTDKDVDSSGNSVKTTWLMKDFAFSEEINDLDFIQNNNLSHYNEGGWESSQIRSILSDTSKFKLYYKDSSNNEVDFLPNVVEVSKTYYDYDSKTQTCNDKYWIPSVRELNFTDSYQYERVANSVEDSGCIYDQYFTENSDTIYNFNPSRCKVGRSYINSDSSASHCYWWTRSACAGGGGGSFCSVNRRGDGGHDGASVFNGVVVGFCLN